MTKILLLCDEVGSWSKEGKKVVKESWEKKKKCKVPVLSLYVLLRVES
jgi:hypothetical protein